MNETLKIVADQLKVPVEMLWEALLKQAMIAGITDVIIYIVVGTLIYGNVRIWKLFHRKISADYGWDEELYIVPITVSVIILVFTIVCVVSLSTTVATFFNPEYWALNEILNHI